METPSAEKCSACKGIGWIVSDMDGRGKARPCPECRPRKKVQGLVSSALIPPRYLDRGFEVYSIHDRSQEVALKKAIDYVEHYPDVPRGLLLVGPCGVGKTHLAVAMLKALIQEKGVRGRFVDEAELLRRLQYSYGPDSPDTERDVLLPLMNVDLLVWDDLGTGRPTAWVRETIRTVLNYRYTYQKQTLMTTNWPLKVPKAGASTSRDAGEQSLEERVGTRLHSRIMEMCEVVEVQGPDARTVIHKAGMDFRKRGSEKASRQADPSQISCPSCKSAKVLVIDRSNEKRSKSGVYVDFACRCQQCSSDFLARLHPDKGLMDYPTVG